MAQKVNNGLHVPLVSDDTAQNNKYIKFDELIQYMQDTQRPFFLDFRDSIITDEQLQNLAQHSITTLMLINCDNITDEGISSLANKDIINLYLSACRVTNTGLEHIFTNSKITTLDMSYNLNVNDETLQSLANSPIRETLTQLDISYTQITDIGLSYLQNCPNLAVLNLEGNYLIMYERLKSMLSSLPRLQKLNVTDCCLMTQAGVNQLRKDYPQIEIIFATFTSFKFL